ncbi:MAG TPA: hypothetical protein VKU19_07560 [Bryobacteraceae bacterium]|nr:hypothetical protein [Bryobacteraceae bacterium]
MQQIEQLLDQKIALVASKADVDLVRSEFADEIAPLKRQLSSIETKIDRLATRTSEDDVATMKDVQQLAERMKNLEKEIAKLKLTHA